MRRWVGRGIDIDSSWSSRGHLNSSGVACIHIFGGGHNNIFDLDGTTINDRSCQRAGGEDCSDDDRRTHLDILIVNWEIKNLRWTWSGSQISELLKGGEVAANSLREAVLVCVLSRRLSARGEW